jgi:hypothetical protein
MTDKVKVPEVTVLERKVGKNSQKLRSRKV